MKINSFPVTIKTKLIIICLILATLSFCTLKNNEKKREDNNKRNQLFLAMVNSSVTSDCIYCTNTQAFQGSCTCYSNIRLGACTGLSSGPAKSNSYKINCKEMTSSGIWHTNESEQSFICTYTTCPPEAYRAAFTANGI